MKAEKLGRKSCCLVIQSCVVFFWYNLYWLQGEQRDIHSIVNQISILHETANNLSELNNTCSSCCICNTFLNIFIETPLMMTGMIMYRCVMIIIENFFSSFFTCLARKIKYRNRGTCCSCDYKFKYWKKNITTQTKQKRKVSLYFLRKTCFLHSRRSLVI